ncbi:MAG: MBL fold metallo-hydrolase [Chloroflexi bacterium]|nr:MBL fold metallo-hydrolase [Chloroflexota bacterium]MBI3742207.1 MBL fold metallo-hydrolase [Chloroflexota bacterium]
MIYQVGKDSGVYCIEGIGQARAYFVAASEYTLIDTGVPSQAPRIVSALAQIGVQPLQVKRIILTHHHWDHVGSLWELQRITHAQVCAHPRDADYITGKRPRRAPRRTLGRIMYGLFTLMGAQKLPPVPIDRALNDGEKIGAFSVIHTPGHTPGHICLQRDDFLFSGDLLFATPGAFRETPHIFTADVPTSRASIAKIAGLDFQVILSGHHAPHVVQSAARVRELANKLGAMENSARVA